MKKLNLKFNRKKKFDFKVRSNNNAKRERTVGEKLFLVLGLAIVVLLFGTIAQRMDVMEKAKINDYDPGASYYATSLQRGSLLFQSFSNFLSKSKDSLISRLIGPIGSSERLITGASVTESTELNGAGVTGDTTLRVMDSLLTRKRTKYNFSCFSSYSISTASIAV